MAMSSSRPYLIRALYDWILDNQCTPYVLVNALSDNVLVPQDYVNQDGQVVLNISPSAVVDFKMDATCLSFRARFGGVPTDIYVPCAAVLGIYAKENQQGMIFEYEPEPEPDPPAPNDNNAGGGRGSQSRPSLKVVK
ncbi:MAG: ClpXP protease specificity-enhancing factor [Cellvibrionaceae bacterium]|nr:ClpXP protease specificity-enhancing factor [Cellvibrionaceae bacterium]